MQDIDILLAINAALVTCGRMQKVTCLDVGVAQEIAGLLQNVCDKVLPQVLVSLEPTSSSIKRRQRGARTSSSSSSPHEGVLIKSVKEVDAGLQRILLNLERLSYVAGHGNISLLSQFPNLWLGFFQDLRYLRASLHSLEICAREILTGINREVFEPSSPEGLASTLSELDLACSHAKDVAQLWGSELRSCAQNHSAAILHILGSLESSGIGNLGAASFRFRRSQTCGQLPNALLSQRLSSQLPTTSLASASVLTPGAHANPASICLPADVEEVVTHIERALLQGCDLELVSQDEAYLQEKLNRLREDPQTPSELLAEALLLSLALKRHLVAEAACSETGFAPESSPRGGGVAIQCATGSGDFSLHAHRYGAGEWVSSRVSCDTLASASYEAAAASPSEEAGHGKHVQRWWRRWQRAQQLHCSSAGVAPAVQTPDAGWGSSPASTHTGACGALQPAVAHLSSSPPLAFFTARAGHACDAGYCAAAAAGSSACMPAAVAVAAASSSVAMVVGPDVPTNDVSTRSASCCSRHPPMHASQHPHGVCMEGCEEGAARPRWLLGCLPVGGRP